MRHFFSHGRQGETELAHPVVIVADLEAHARSGTRTATLRQIMDKPPFAQSALGS